MKSVHFYNKLYFFPPNPFSNYFEISFHKNVSVLHFFTLLSLFYVTIVQSKTHYLHLIQKHAFHSNT